MVIRKLEKLEAPPIDLLLLADPSRHMIEEYLTRSQCYVAEQKGSIIGVYVLLPTRPKTVELVNIAVQEDVQGQGIGKALVNHAISQAKQNGAKTIEIGTGSTGVTQLALYQKCGFRVTGIDINFFIRHYDEPIYENGMQLKDMIRLSQDL